MLFYSYFDIVMFLLVLIDNYAEFNNLLDFECDFIADFDFIFYNFGDVSVNIYFIFYYVFIRVDNDFIRNFLSDDIDFSFLRLFEIYLSFIN
jgi:hypothetical protein